MLQINPKQFEVFQQQAELQFAQKLQHALAGKYPHMLSRFPDGIQLKIVGNMIDRAKRWGIDWKSSLVIFAELMISIAPNFDQQADIKRVLESDKEQANQRIKAITEYVPDSAWSQAEANSDDLPYFLSAEFLNASLTDQTARAIPLVLWDKEAEFDPHQYATSACQYANQLGFNDINDAPLTIVVWRSLYGSKFNDPELYPWASDILDNKRPAWERIAMLKFRIALDHGRMV
jgi:hypothetical protein